MLLALGNKTLAGGGGANRRRRLGSDGSRHRLKRRRCPRQPPYRGPRAEATRGRAGGRVCRTLPTRARLLEVLKPREPSHLSSRSLRESSSQRIGTIPRLAHKSQVISGLCPLWASLCSQWVARARSLSLPAPAAPPSLAAAAAAAAAAGAAERWVARGGASRAASLPALSPSPPTTRASSGEAPVVLCAAGVTLIVIRVSR